MGKSENGPDWTDVEMILRAMSALHGGDAGLTVLPVGIGSSGGLSVAASMMFSVPGKTAEETCVSVIKVWPCVAHATFPGHCFALLHELDFKISKAYQQQQLWP